MRTAIEDITAALRLYFDALYHCNVGMLENIFHAAAVYATTDETPFLHRTMAEYFRLSQRVNLGRHGTRLAVITSKRSILPATR